MKTLYSLTSLGFSFLAAADTGSTFSLQSLSDLKSATGKIVAVILIFAFLAGIILIVVGLKKKGEEPGEALKLMLSGAFFAIAPLVLGLFFYVFGLGGAVSDAAW